MSETAIVTSSVELILTVVVSLFFAIIAIYRKTLISNALAVICWLTCGMVNFLYDPLGIGQYISYIFFAVGVVFIFQLYLNIAAWYNEKENGSYQVEPL